MIIEIYHHRPGKALKRFFEGLMAILLILSAAMLEACSGTRLTKPMDGNVSNAVSGIKQLIGIEDSEMLLYKLDELPPGTSACDWTAFAFAQAGVKDAYSAYAKGLENYVTEKLSFSDRLDGYRATEYHRIALTARALGCDPRTFGRMPDGSSADLIAMGTYNYAGDLGEQGLNGYIFALLTLDSDDYAVPNNARYTRERILRSILDSEEASGGFGLNTGDFDVDITAMALQALAPYKERADVGAVIDRSLNRLAEAMTVNCAFASYGSENLESTAQVVIALCALGIDPRSDARFKSGGMDAIQAMELFKLPSGCFTHKFEPFEGNIVASEQALRAYIALYKFQAKMGGLYKLSFIPLGG